MILKNKVILGQPLKTRLIFKTCNPYNLKCEFNQETQIKTN